MRVSYSPGYYASIPDGHIFPMGKFDGLHRYLTDEGIVTSADVICPREVELSSLMLVHTPRYLDCILNGNLDRKEERRMGLPWSPSLARRSRLAVQGTINAAMMALEDGISGNLAGGTHHAFPDYGEGFCVFNDVCVAVRTLKQAHWIKKVLIIDLDVHHGNGTANYFRNDPDVFTFSMHGEKNFPFVKPPSSYDIGLPDKTGDQVYLRTLEEALGMVFGSFSPDLVIYLGGIDPLESDHFGRLSLSLNGLRKREEMVIHAVKENDIPLVLLLSGGYAPTLKETVTAHAMMFRVARELV
jgi:acetoin utilization deacetylase AcuC-like enzyme